MIHVAKAWPILYDSCSECVAHFVRFMWRKLGIYYTIDVTSAWHIMTYCTIDVGNNRHILCDSSSELGIYCAIHTVNTYITYIT